MRHCSCSVARKPPIWRSLRTRQRRQSQTPQFDPIWTGAYLGINGGVSAGKYDYSGSIGGPSFIPPVAVPLTGSLNSSGIFGGGQIGYNYRFAPKWVAGVEADIDASNIAGNLSVSASPLVSLSGGTKLDYFGTIRGRLGYLVTPSALLYATGGWAYGQNTSSLHLTTIIPGIAHSSSDTHFKSGWALGGGLEYALNSRLSAKVEYLYVDLGKTPIASGFLFTGVPGSISEKTSFQTIKVGLNYKFGSAKAAEFTTEAPPPPPVHWTGLYVGANGGVGGNKTDYPFSINLGTPFWGSASLTSSGGFGGGQIGYNYQFSSDWVAGIEADIDASDIDGKLSASASTPGGSGSISAGTKLDWFGTVRGRIGYLLTPSALLYGTGGLAFGHTTSSASLALSPGGGGSVSRGHDKSGWTVGVGLEYALTPHWSAKAEYQYMDLGTDNIASVAGPGGTGASLSEKTTVNVMKAGLNYRF